MTKRQILSVAVASSMFFAAAAPAAKAYDGLKADFATCIQGDTRTQAPAMVAACSRLIANAKAENETVGTFYAMRSMVSTDKQRNCQDARKAVSMIKSPKLRTSALELEKVHCTPAPRSDADEQHGTDFYANLSCEQLWYERNAILARHGYCFETARALETFGNVCAPPNGKLPANLDGVVSNIKTWAQQRGCG